MNLDEALAAAENADLPPEMRSAIEFIQKNITQLRDGDLLRQVDALVDINEAVGGFSTKTGEGGTAGEIDVQQQALIRSVNSLVEAFTKVMNDIFSYPTTEIPLRFTKYFITIVNKTCSQKELMREVGYS